MSLPNFVKLQVEPAGRREESAGAAAAGDNYGLDDEAVSHRPIVSFIHRLVTVVPTSLSSS